MSNCKCRHCACDNKPEEKTPEEKIADLEKAIEDLGYKVETPEGDIGISEKYKTKKTCFQIQSTDG